MSKSSKTKEKGKSAKGKKGTKKKGKSKAEKLREKLEWVAVKRSGIHARGLFAKKAIPEGTRVIEYIGPKITKAESERRGHEQDAIGRDTGEGMVYIFTLNKRHDIDGNVEWNWARLANHSCDPNCTTDVIRGRIWLIADRSIEKGEEIVYDYNFDLDYYEEHPCLCGTDNCCGYIVGETYRDKLAKLIKKKKKKAKKKAKKRGKK
ncbi:MAG: SET domain-containing protein-lysine N-methyltransferase [Verrucomicrobiota bacterium]